MFYSQFTSQKYYFDTYYTPYLVLLYSEYPFPLKQLNLISNYPHTWPLYVVRPSIGVVVEPDMIINDLEKFWGLGDAACLQLGPHRHIWKVVF